MDKNNIVFLIVLTSVSLSSWAGYYCYNKIKSLPLQKVVVTNNIPKILDNNEAIDAYKNKYSTKADHKAFAYSIDGFYGYCFNRVNMEEAKSCALRYCEYYRQGRLDPCEIISVDGNTNVSHSVLRCDANMRQFLGCSGTGLTRGGIVLSRNSFSGLKQACANYCSHGSSLTFQVTCAQLYNVNPTQTNAGCNCSNGSVVPNPNLQAGGSQYASSCT